MYLRNATGQGPPRPLYPAARGAPLASRSATDNRRETDGIRQKRWESLQAPGQGNKQKWRRESELSLRHFCLFPARFARLGPASPAAQERHLPTPRGRVQGPMGPGSGLGGEEPPTSPSAARCIQRRSCANPHRPRYFAFCSLRKSASARRQKRWMSSISWGS